MRFINSNSKIRICDHSETLHRRCGVFYYRSLVRQSLTEKEKSEETEGSAKSEFRSTASVHQFIGNLFNFTADIDKALKDHRIKITALAGKDHVIGIFVAEG